MSERLGTSSWMTYTLWFAGIYNVLAGLLAVSFTSSLLGWLSLEQPLYPGIWRFAGMLVAIYGVGFLVAARDPIRHWPIVLVGLMTKILGPVLFVAGVNPGGVPWGAGAAVLINDALWWVPFCLILREAYRDHIGGVRTASPEIQRMALRRETQYGDSLVELSRRSPILLVFLRHYGCPFCRQALADLGRRRRSIQAAGTRIVLVHMATEVQASAMFARYGMEDLPRISDPHRHVYRAFGLGRGDILRLAGPRVWWPTLRATINGHGIGRAVGDWLQMPGVFLLFHGEVLQSYRHDVISDRPDYHQLSGVSTEAK